MPTSSSRVGSEEPSATTKPTGKPGRRAYTKTLYDALLVGYREAPGNAAHAARVAGCERRCAQRAYETGWRGLPWAKPIKAVLAEETQAARARAAELERRRREADDGKREQARLEAVESEAQERSILKAARQDVLAAAVISAELVPAMRALVRVVMLGAGLDPQTGRPALDAQGKPVAATIDAKSAVIMMNRWTGMVGKLVYSTETLVQLGRTDRGKPNAIIGHAEVEMTPEQTEEELLAGVELLARMKGADPELVAAFMQAVGSTGGGGAGAGADVDRVKALLPALTSGGERAQVGEETDGTY